MKRLLLIILTLSLAGCQKVIDPGELPNQEPRLVVNAVLSTDSAVVVHVSTSRSILSSKAYTEVNNATCDLYENDNFVERQSTGDKGVYTFSHTAGPGRGYRLEASTSTFTKVTGSTSMPAAPQIKGYQRYDTINSLVSAIAQMGSWQIGGNLKISFSIIDGPGTNRYIANVSATVVDSLDNAIPVGAFVSNNRQFQNLEYFEEGMVFTDDLLVNGNELPVDITINVTGIVQTAPRYIVLSAIVYSFSDELYRYESTYQQQRSSGVALFAEPVQVFSNIHGGLGIVGGKSISRFTLDTMALHR